AIWASDFIASPITDCSEPVVYSMNRVGEPKNIDSTGIVLTCADLGTLVVEIWAWDAAGNSDFCETYINVQDNMGNCTGSSPAIAGAVETEYEAPVEDVTISLSGQGAASMQTGADGTYSFAGLVEGYDYTIIPERDGDYLNGVSTFDLVLISQHILGVQLLDSPYKRIAADVNKSESITTLDLIQLRKLILSIDTEFSNNTSWRFVDAAYVFPNPQDPWQEVFPELVNANDLSEYGIAGLDFIAVKIGDVTEDAETTSLLAVEGRTVESTLYLQAEEVAMKAGQEYTTNFTIEELQSLYGYQATLNFNTEAVELVDILEGVASEDNFGFTYLDEGLITTSWNWVPDTEEELPTTVMYSLVLRAKVDVNLSEVMSVSSRITKAEAYAVDGQFMDVGLSFGLSTPVAKADQFELYQNQPNPANGETLIGFNLPEAATATMTISDITGRVIKLIRLDAVKGYNSVVINARNLPKGVLQYTVKAGQYTDTKSMIITE
ncbi:MAG: T9SS type A sorting domain-containing protein, partial [Chitinophagales bacterium]|nr:T9SS type A sorting domain-containing protein [Chitinophagales bacterium]